MSLTSRLQFEVAVSLEYLQAILTFLCNPDLSKALVVLQREIVAYLFSGMWPKNPYTELFRFWIFLQLYGSFLVYHEYSPRHPSIALYKAISRFHYYSTNCTSVHYRKRKNKRTLDVYRSITWRLEQHENIQLWVQQWQRNNQAFMSYDWFLLPYFNGLALELAWYSVLKG